MIAELDPAPPGILEAAIALVEEGMLPEEAAGLELGSHPIPLHRLRQAPHGGFDPAVPLVGWVFPIFRDDLLDAVALISDETGELVGILADASPGTSIHTAFEMALGIGNNMPGLCRLRLVQAPGSLEAFWLQGEHDSFVDAACPRVLSGPEFVAIIGAAGEGPFDDLAQNAAGDDASGGDDVVDHGHDNRGGDGRGGDPDGGEAHGIHDAAADDPVGGDGEG